MRSCHPIVQQRYSKAVLSLDSQGPPRGSLSHRRKREKLVRRHFQSGKRVRRKNCMQGPDLMESSNLEETVRWRSVANPIIYRYNIPMKDVPVCKALRYFPTPQNAVTDPSP